MAKRINGVTSQRQENWYLHHRKSLEEGNTYEPFWRTDDVPSYGVKSKVPHFTDPKRLVHVLSQNELWMYLHLAQNPLVIEVYEQYAIPLEYSLPIAEQIGIKHPVYVGTTVPIVQTIDFIVDMIDVDTREVIQKAFPVKQPDDAAKLRTEEKLAIQQVYSEFNDIEYELITSEVLRTNHSINLESLFRYRELSPLLQQVSSRWRNNFFSVLFDNRHDRAAHLIQKSNQTTGVDFLTGVSIFYNSLWQNQIDMDWSRLLKLECAASDLGLSAND